VHKSFENDLGICRNLQIDRFTTNQRNRLAAQSSSHGKFIGAVGKFADGRQDNCWVYSDGDRHRHILFFRIVLANMPRPVLRRADVNPNSLAVLDL
jgi:hypothetical protein